MTNLRKAVAATLVVCVMALLFASVPAVSAESDEPEPLNCDIALKYDFSPGITNPHWIGTLDGCALEGATIEFWEKPDNYVVGATEHFFETMLITMGSDTIKGWDMGIWNFATFKFRAHGAVTEATGDLAYLAGYNVHEMGYTTAFPPPQGVYVVYGTGTMSLVAP